MKKTQTILLAAHGSRHPAANEEVQQLAKDLSQALQTKAQAVFLELAEPSIEQGIEQAIKNGSEKILLMPYFLTQGRHTSKDLPRIAARAQKKFPQQKIQVLDYLGKSSQLLPSLQATCQAHLD